MIPYTKIIRSIKLSQCCFLPILFFRNSCQNTCVHSQAFSSTLHLNCYRFSTKPICMAAWENLIKIFVDKFWHASNILFNFNYFLPKIYFVIFVSRKNKYILLNHEICLRMPKIKFRLHSNLAFAICLCKDHAVQGSSL